jgi:N-acetyl-gamma-glutamyl-phosphate reductase
MATCYLRAKPGVDAEAISKAYRDAYEGKSFVELASPDDVSLAHVVGTNACRIGFAARSGRIVVVSVIDNLLKGAAGQALQNANLALGLPETRGLDRLQRSAA